MPPFSQGQDGDPFERCDVLLDFVSLFRFRRLSLMPELSSPVAPLALRTVGVERPLSSAFGSSVRSMGYAGLSGFSLLKWLSKSWSGEVPSGWLGRETAGSCKLKLLASEFVTNASGYSGARRWKLHVALEFDDTCPSGPSWAGSCGAHSALEDVLNAHAGELSALLARGAGCRGAVSATRHSLSASVFASSIGSGVIGVARALVASHQTEGVSSSSSTKGMGNAGAIHGAFHIVSGGTTSVRLSGKAGAPAIIVAGRNFGSTSASGRVGGDV